MISVCVTSAPMLSPLSVIFSPRRSAAREMSTTTLGGAWDENFEIGQQIGAARKYLHVWPVLGEQRHGVLGIGGRYEFKPLHQISGVSLRR